MPQQLVLCVSLCLLDNDYKYLFYVFWNLITRISRNPSHHGLKTKSQNQFTRNSIDRKVLRRYQGSLTLDRSTSIEQVSGSTVLAFLEQSILYLQ